MKLSNYHISLNINLFDTIIMEKKRKNNRAFLPSIEQFLVFLQTGHSSYGTMLKK